jgi:hypothetical protein
MNSQDALQAILLEAGVAMGAFRQVSSPDRAVVIFRRMGYEFPIGAFGGALSGLAAQAESLISTVRKLAAASTDSDAASAVADLFSKLVSTVGAVNQLHAELQTGAAATPNLDDFPRRLTDFLVLDYLDRRRSQLHETLRLIGLIDYESNPAPGQSTRLINWERFGQLLTDPKQIANDVYQWNSSFDTDKFLLRLEGVMRAAVLPGGLYPQLDTTRTLLGNTSPNIQELRLPIFQKGLTPTNYSQFGITFSPAEAQGGRKKGIALLPYLMGATDFQFDVCDRGELVFESSADIKGIGVVVRPPFNAEGILNLTGAFKTSLLIREKPDRSEEIILIGSPGGSRLAAQGLGVNWFAHDLRGKLDLGVEAQLQALRLVIKGDEGDGFLQKILSGINFEAEASLSFGMSLLAGFTFQAGAKLAIELSAHIDLGPVQIKGLRLALEPTGDHINLDAGVNFSADLGPLNASVENVGIRAALRFQQGNLGPADLGVSFKPPDGIGLSIDAGIISGGGFVKFDPDHGEYDGILHFSIADMVSVTAIGLITTKMPDGSSGFSLLIILTADFGAGFQLGFGFSLLAVGGLLGLNRSILFQPLMDAVRTDAIESIMFPQNVIANATRIISDLRAIFPPQEGTFLIGPMAKIGWGEPALISLSLGIIIEIPPGDVAIVGVLKVALPTDDQAIIKLQVNFAGALEFDKQRFYFYATLYDSHVLFITLEGSMGVLFAYGDDANFVVSIGGFHPQFSPPPLPFPTPTRIQINIINESFARVRCDGYFAVTSNTVQFGAHAEFFFGFSAVSIQGQSGFDALIQFSPFQFTLSVSTSFSVDIFGFGVYGIGMSLTVTGPAPWHFQGYASLSFFFFSIDIPVNFTFGDNPDTMLPPVQVLPILVTEFGKISNWRALLPTGSNLLVSLRKLDPGDTALVLHPVGTLKVSQRAVPLDVTLDKVGNQKPSDANRFSLTASAGGLVRAGVVKEQFAVAQYQDMADADKLSQQAYAPLDSGIELSAAGNLYGSAVATVRNVRYDLTIIDVTIQPFRKRFQSFPNSLFMHFVAGSAVMRCPLSAYAQAQVQPILEKVVVNPEAFAVAHVADNTAYNAQTAVFSSQFAASDYLNTAIAKDPSLSGTLHVIPQFEVAA